MPREHVYARHATVRAGDLLVLAARDRVTVLRRRHDLLLEFANDVVSTLRGQDVAVTPERVRTYHAQLVERLRALPLDGEVDEGGDLVPTGPGVRRTYRTHASGEPTAEAPDAADEPVRVRLRATVTWQPDGGEVVLLLDGEDDRGVAVALGGPAVPLDRRACNRLLGTLRRASDEAHGELA